MARCVGWAMSDIGFKLKKSPTSLIVQSIDRALKMSGLQAKDLDGLVACPSLAEPRFMQAHHVANAANLLSGDRGANPFVVRTVDTGGASPISMLLQAKRMVEVEGCRAVAIVAGDAVSSLPSAEFLRRADESCGALAPGTEEPPQPFEPVTLPTPVIPHGYAHAAAAHMHVFPGLRREQLAMVPVLMSHQAFHHPAAARSAAGGHDPDPAGGAGRRRPLRVDEVLAAREIAPRVGLHECARRADGAACVIVAAPAAAKTGPTAAAARSFPHPCPVVASGGEAAGPPALPRRLPDAAAALGSAAAAFRAAFAGAGLPSAAERAAEVRAAARGGSPACRVGGVDYWGLYDCYPICFVRAVEAAGLAEQGKGGEWVESWHSHLVAGRGLRAGELPVNTHGGLLGWAAPWEVPAMLSLVEALDQLAGRAAGRQVPDCRTAVVYGNGGVFGASAVAVLRAAA